MRLPSKEPSPENPIGLPVAIGLLLGLLSFSALAVSHASLRPEEIGLGQNTIRAVASFDGRVISGGGSSIPRLLETFGEMRRDSQQIALWLGASQLQSINRFEHGDQLAVFYASKRARERRSRLSYLQVASPNANLKDLLATYLAFRAADSLPDALILALTYDDLREPGVKLTFLKQLEVVSDTWVRDGGLAVARLRATLESRDRESSLPLARSPIQGTPQERLETEIVEQLEAYWPGYRHRAKLLATGELMLRSALASLLGSVLERRVPEIPRAPYDQNMAALDSILRLARRDAVPVLIYKVPHRPGEKVFYHNRARYDRFFADLSARCLASGIEYRDLETLVPARYWGITNEGRPDVFHFSDYGHRQLGIAIDLALDEAAIDAVQ